MEYRLFDFQVCPLFLAHATGNYWQLTTPNMTVKWMKQLKWFQGVSNAWWGPSKTNESDDNQWQDMINGAFIQMSKRLTDSKTAGAFY